MSHILVLTHASLAEQPYGGAQRVTALLDAIGEPALLCQPGRSHPRHEVWSYPRDFGKKKFLINWGIFNFYWPSNAQRVRDALARRQIAAAVLTSIWNYHPLRDTPGLPKVLDAQNVEARAIGERFGHHHPFTRMVHAHEARVLQAMDRVCACSEVDRELFVDSYGLDPAHVSVVPNGVHLRPAADAHLPAELPNEWNERLGAATVLFFMGKLDYQPNRAALQFMSDSLLPELERRAPGRFKILVCGDPHPPGSFHHAMLFAGRVPTLTPYLQRANICIAPLASGSGTRLKVLEYLAAEKAVVSTPKGAEGLACESGTHLLVTELRDFATTVLALADDSERAAALGRAGGALVRGRYDWRMSQSSWRNVLADY